MTNVVIDSNLFFSGLRTPNNWVRDTLYRPDIRVFSPNFLIVEIFKYKEKIVARSKSDESEVYELLNLLLQRITFVNEEAISLGNLIHAHRLCADIDEKDMLFVALALDLSALYWTRDQKLKDGLQRKGFVQFFEP
ncbi:hypothetical protein FAES_4143 [Fibrella aestuarina BUZ 2]|uniref:PIN domain-containing protein n=1 Tax=Fibrella aestuarina BUZ 2 TaxID=1166018 RepID=I0KDE0_9BACT|nr:PIN domain-containing protein [Fibrella aestuarina]CCH02143.1 hypothetical protein FAES_4143 [Fibrella aestuarina BUZ 2]